MTIKPPFASESRKEEVRGDVHKNSIESLRWMFNRYVDFYHHISRAHIERYVCKFVDRYNSREMGAEMQMEKMVGAMVSKCLRYDDPIAA